MLTALHLTALHLPGMPGRGLARLVKACLPGQLLAFASGGGQSSDVADAHLAKPYVAQQLETLLQRLA